MQPSSFFWNVSYRPGRLLERDVVSREVHHAERVGGVLDERHEVVDPALHVALAHAQADLLVEQRLHRQDVGIPGVDAAQRHGAAAADEVDRGVEAASRSTPAFSMSGRATASGSRPTAFCARRTPPLPCASSPDGVDDRVRAAPVGEIAELLDDVSREVERLDAVPLGHLAALRHRVDRQHAKAAVHADARRRTGRPARDP